MDYTILNSFLDELDKIAKELSQREKQRLLETATRAGVEGTGALLGGVGGGYLAKKIYPDVPMAPVVGVAAGIGGGRMLGHYAGTSLGKYVGKKYGDRYGLRDPSSVLS